MLLGVDTGGTFTDFVLIDGTEIRLHKTLSTPAAPERAIQSGISEMGLDAAVVAGRIRIVHGSTIATNAALERKGVTTAYVTNSGLADVLTLARQQRRALYELTPTAETAPVPPELCLEIPARLDFRGHELTPLRDADVDDLLARIRALAPRAVAINLLYSWLDARHEEALEQAIGSTFADVFVTRSSFVLPEYREYERGMATWLNAWLGPLVQGYLERLEVALAPCRVAIMQSSGGTMEAAVASRRAVNLLVSGPAGGLAGAQAIGRAAGIERLLTFDMGGTSTDVALIDGEPELTSEGRLGPWPVAVPMLDIHTIGAGGGSIARLDAGGALQVGPESAGADPGPACYGQGGRAATVTDAHVVLGQLPADAALGGTLRLDVAAARTAVGRIAEGLAVPVEVAARGILRVANEHMAQALRVMSIERGRDPRGMVLCCFGGAGGLHLCDLAATLGMDRAMIPNNGGVLSAFGMLVARPERQLTRTLREDLATLGRERLREAREALGDQGRAELEREGHDPTAFEEEAFVDLRYRGQAFALTLGWSEDREALSEQFHRQHRERYGHSLDGIVELVTLRLRIRAAGHAVVLPEIVCGEPAAPEGTVAVTDLGAAVPVFTRATLVAGQQIRGPALVVEATATSLITAGWTAAVDATGNLLLERDRAHGS